MFKTVLTSTPSSPVYPHLVTLQLSIPYIDVEQLVINGRVDRSKFTPGCNVFTMPGPARWLVYSNLFYFYCETSTIAYENHVNLFLEPTNSKQLLYINYNLFSANFISVKSLLIWGEILVPKSKFPLSVVQFCWIADDIIGVKNVTSVVKKSSSTKLNMWKQSYKTPIHVSYKT